MMLSFLLRKYQFVRTVCTMTMRHWMLCFRRAKSLAPFQMNTLSVMLDASLDSLLPHMGQTSCALWVLLHRSQARQFPCKQKTFIMSITPSQAILGYLQTPSFCHPSSIHKASAPQTHLQWLSRHLFTLYPLIAIHELLSSPVVVR